MAKDWLTKLGLGVIIAFLVYSFVFLGLGLFVERPDYPSVDCDRFLPGGDENTDCQNQWDEAQAQYDEEMETYGKLNFFVYTVTAVASIVIALSIGSTAITWGLILSAIIQFSTGVFSYWDYMNKYLRFGVMAVVLAVVLYVTYKRTSR